MTGSRYRIEPLSRAHRTDEFNCSRIGHVGYLEKEAFMDVERAACACFVMTERITGRIAGYYTLWPVVLQFDGVLPGEVPRLGSAGAAPALYIKRLSVDDEFLADQLEQLLVVDAMRRASRQDLAAIALGLDIDDIGDVQLFARLGFENFEGEHYWAFLDAVHQRFWATPRSLRVPTPSDRKKRE